jgi:hypothetical protein
MPQVRPAPGAPVFKFDVRSARTKEAAPPLPTVVLARPPPSAASRAAEAIALPVPVSRPLPRVRTHAAGGPLS